MSKEKAEKAKANKIKLRKLLGLRAELQAIFGIARVSMKKQFLNAKYLLACDGDVKAFDEAKKVIDGQFAELQPDGRKLIPAAKTEEYNRQINDLLDQEIALPAVEFPLTLEELENLPGEFDITPVNLLEYLQQ